VGEEEEEERATQAATIDPFYDVTDGLRAAQ
jgi:hypothetical protein